MQVLGLAAAQFDALFISHQHGDHTAGIPWILEENPSIAFLKNSFGEGYLAGGTGKELIIY